ncbi:MAG: tRNA 2-thiocytidine biosynthesis protein TtcA [Clostridiales bacterium]|nr:tRNA 2-thiocytidine biosynthesis protein TtcA [Clostridiales bacterium]
MKKILGGIRDVCRDFELISENDVIAVGVSGGKDSIVLLKALALYRYFSPAKFTLKAITLDMGLFSPDTDAIGDFCRELQVDYHVEHTQIGNVVFEIRGESNPCSLCANMKRGVLCSTAKELGCNKLALGHHFDDALETLFLNLFYGGRMATFSPTSYLDRSDITVIRPMIYASEGDVVDCAKRNALPVFKSGCPADGFTKREDIKRFISETEKTYPDVKKKFLKALKSKSTQRLWYDG